jgi:hypothetical protein
LQMLRSWFRGEGPEREEKLHADMSR